MATPVDGSRIRWSNIRFAQVKESYLYDDGFLFLSKDPVAWIEHNHSDRLSVRKLELCFLDDWEKIGDSIAELSELTHLYIQHCWSLKYLPNSIVQLSKLSTLQVDGCDNLEGLPVNMGDLTNLTYLSLFDCTGIKYLPNSVAKLAMLSTLEVIRCDSLEALPPNLNVVELRVEQCCRLQNIPPGLNKVQHLDLELCSHTVDEILNSVDTKTPRKLTISMCRKHPVKDFLTNWNEFVNIETLIIIHAYNMEKLPRFTRLLNLNTLELWKCRQVLIPENLNLNKLKLVKSSVESVPTSIRHLEIVHDEEYCLNFCGGHFEFEMCLKELVNLKTLSLTCCSVIDPPTIAGQHFLQILLFRDCFNLRKLMPNLDEFVGLCTVDVSGTRIKSLPECITNLPNLQRLILPKCFRRRNLPNLFLRKDSIVKIEFDTKMVRYYGSSKEASDEENEITPGSVVGLDELQGRESREDGIFNVHTSSQMPNPSEANQGVVAVDFHISDWNFSTGENSHHATHCLQNQEMENLSSGLHSVDNANFYENRQMEPMNLENVVAVTSFDQLISGASAHDVNNHDDVVDPENNNNPDGGHKKGNKQKIEIHRDQIQSLRDEHFSLVEAAKKLGVSRSTMKRRCKELGLGKWPSSKQKKSDSTKKRITTKSPPRGQPSQPNLVECSNPAGPEYALECLELNQHNPSEQEVPESNFIDHTTANATTDCVEDLNVATHRHVNVHESVPECTVGTGGHSLLGNVQESLSSSSFDIKATYKDDMVRFKWSSTASLEELKKAVVENLEIELGSFKLKYQDEEDDWLLIKSSEHLERAFTSIKNNILRLKVIDL